MHPTIGPSLLQHISSYNESTATEYTVYGYMRLHMMLLLVQEGRAERTPALGDLPRGLAGTAVTYHGSNLLAHKKEIKHAFAVYLL